MNYQRIYNEIISNAKLRGLDKKCISFYTEKHHIIPRCMKGTNDEYNLVLLSGREHYICHWLLWKSNKENKKLSRAYHAMLSVNNKHYKAENISSKQYDMIRKDFAECMRQSKLGTKLSEETKMKMRASHKGIKPTWCIGKPAWNKGLKTPDDVCEKLKNNKNALGCVRSNESKERYRKSKLGILNPMFGKEPANKLIKRI